MQYAPGLHTKWPWDVVTKFDRRILSQSYTGETFLTNDGRGLIVDFYARVEQVFRNHLVRLRTEDRAG